MSSVIVVIYAATMKRVLILLETLQHLQFYPAVGCSKAFSHRTRKKEEEGRPLRLGSGGMERGGGGKEEKQEGRFDGKEAN